jgi:GNAT superfamily N-acetyltransferase
LDQPRPLSARTHCRKRRPEGRERGTAPESVQIEPAAGPSAGLRIDPVLSTEEVQQTDLGGLSHFFDRFLPQFAEGTLGVGGEVRVARGPRGVDGVSLFHDVERVLTIFARDAATAAALLAGRDRVDVFSEFALAAPTETYQVLTADLPPEPSPHRFRHPVRQLRSADRPGVVALMAEVYGRVDERWFRPIPPPPEKGFVVEVDGEVVGAAWASVAGGAARFHSLSVRPRFRRLGIGTDLWHARALWARDRGARHLITEISEHNQPSLAISSRAGMRRVGEMYRFHRP